jgi:putative tryptophan/tyrosine transport system substrate-binding protein
MTRCEFITLRGGAAAAWPLAARTQSQRVRRIGVLMADPESHPEYQINLAAFREGWSDDNGDDNGDASDASSRSA